MDELDWMHDDMQDRVFEIDRARRNNLVFYGVRSGDGEGGEECASYIRKLFNTYLQVGKGMTCCIYGGIEGAFCR